MSAPILVPTLGESVTEATVAKWIKKPGETVNEDDTQVTKDNVTLLIDPMSLQYLSGSEIDYQDKKPSNDKDLRSIVNYATIVKLIKKLIKKKHYNFLETLAEAVFDELFKDKRIGKIMLKIEKMEILKECSSVGIQITKKRSHDKF